MAGQQYTDERRQEALDAYQEHGPAEAERLTGVPRKTIASWARRAGVQMDAAAVEDRLRLATEVAALKAEEKRARLAVAMYDKLAEALDRLGKNSLANSQESRLINVLAEKAQLLAGNPTSRTEVDVADRDARLAAVHQIKEQAAKRAAGQSQEESA